jgi:hypothetical protein
MMMNKIVRFIVVGTVMCATFIGVILNGISGTVAEAISIGSDRFTASAIVESFEGLVPAANIPQVDSSGILKPGVNGPFTFSSGVTLTRPVPNMPPPAASGVLVGDFSIGRAIFGLGENGQIQSVADIPNGTAYFALNAHPGPIEFTFPSPVLRVGAFITGGGSPGGAGILSAFDRSGNILESVRRSKVNVSDWKTNFLGVEDPGITRITFSDTDAPLGFNTLVLDSLTFESVPEPASISLVLLGCFTMFFLANWEKLRRGHVKRGALRYLQPRKSDHHSR